MKKQNRKTAVWGDNAYVLEFTGDGLLIPTREAGELIKAMMNDIGCLALRAAIKLNIDADDAQQGIAEATITLMREWNPKKSNWMSHWRSNAYRRLINSVLPWKNGYRSRELCDSPLLEEIYG